MLIASCHVLLKVVFHEIDALCLVIHIDLESGESQVQTLQHDTTKRLPTTEEVNDNTTSDYISHIRKQNTRQKLYLLSGSAR